MKLQLLDELIALGHSDIRSTDCIIAVGLENLPEPDIARAQKLFSKTASFPCSLNSHHSLQEFLDTPLASPLHIEVTRITDENLIALKMSHILGDAVSMFLFLKAMFGEDVEPGEPELRSFPQKKDTPHRFFLKSKLWPRHGKRSFGRRFLRGSVIHGDQNVPVLNDLMIYLLLESLPYSRKAVWVPVNVRKNFWKGFGNGLSRLRIYPPKGRDDAEKLSHIRKQKKEAMASGEVALPPADFDLRNWEDRLLYEIWIRRPRVDWGSLSLSHVTNSGGFLDGFSHIAGISNLMPAHNGAIFAVTHRGKTDFTLTYDPNIVSDDEAANLMRDFLVRLRAKLSCD